MYEVNPKHKENVRVKNGVKVLYLKIMRALYVCMESEILWYDIYSKNRKARGFLVNTYDRLKSNSTIKVKQFKISWYVDNNKISHPGEEEKHERN